MARIEHHIEGPNGSEIKLVAQECFGSGLTRSVDVFALHRASPDQPWRQLNNRPDPAWRSMSVQDYVQTGRSELLRMVSPAQIMQLIHRLNALQYEDEPIQNVDVAPADPVQLPVNRPRFA